MREDSHSHTSVAIADAIGAVETPVLEVRILVMLYVIREEYVPDIQSLIGGSQNYVSTFL